jgi:hypothetical protein
MRRIEIGEHVSKAVSSPGKANNGKANNGKANNRKVAGKRRTVTPMATMPIATGAPSKASSARRFARHGCLP